MSRHTGGRTGDRRAQTSLAAVALALLTLTVVTGLALAVADGALASAERDAQDRRIASSLASDLVATESPLTERANVFNATRLERIDGTALERDFPAAVEGDVRVRVNDTTVAETGDAGDGTTVRRLVVVERQDRRAMTPDLEPGRAVTLPRRSGAATLEIDPPTGSTVSTVRANDRVALHDEGGLRGTFTVALSRHETTTLRFVGTGPLPEGSVEVRYDPAETAKSVMEVTADA